MFNIFRKKHIPHPDGLPSTSYSQGIVFTGGAESLAYINTRPRPLETWPAGFIPRRDIQVREPQIVYQFNALPVLSILPGIQAGQIPLQSLLKEGQLDTRNINNALINNTLFGGVQG